VGGDFFPRVKTIAGQVLVFHRGLFCGIALRGTANDGIGAIPSIAACRCLFGLPIVRHRHVESMQEVGNV
jgi:hypothetical protein